MATDRGRVGGFALLMLVVAGFEAYFLRLRGEELGRDGQYPAALAAAAGIAAVTVFGWRWLARRWEGLGRGTTRAVTLVAWLLVVGFFIAGRLSAEASFFLHVIALGLVLGIGAASALTALRPEQLESSADDP